MAFRKLLEIAIIFSVFSVTASERCMLFTNPESCLGKTSAILEGVKYDVRETENATIYVVSPRNNPTGLIVSVSTNGDIVYNIRYSNSTARSAPSPEIFEKFKDSVKKTRPTDLWAERESGTGDVEVFEDKYLRIAIFVNAVVLHSHLHYSSTAEKCQRL